MPRVLVVDGSLSVRNMVEHALEMKRFEVLFASTVETALPDLLRSM